MNLLIKYFTFYLLTQIQCAKILVVIPTPSISHQVAFRPLTEELARTHEVTVITTDPTFNRIDNLTEIDVHDVSYKVLRESSLHELVAKDNDMVSHADTVFRLVTAVLEIQLQVNEIKELFKEHFDLLLLEAFSRPALILSHIFKAPVILVSSFGVTYHEDHIVGALSHPFLFPNLWHYRFYNLTLWEKVKETWNLWKIKQVFDESEIRDNAMLGHMFGDVPSLSELSNNVEMLFLNVHPIWADNKPVPPSVVYVGGMREKPRGNLPQELQSYMDLSTQDIIYFSFGTNVRPSLLHRKTIDTLFNVLSRLPYNVIMRWDTKDYPDVAPNVKFYNWLPQADLLKHEKVKLFINQGGLQSIEESISAGVPMIGFPKFGDQPYNVEKYVHLKIGIQLDIDTITEETFEEAIYKIVNDTSYRQNIIHLRTIIFDQPEPPLHRAVWWVDHILRHGGRHLRSPAANMDWVQYYEVKLLLSVLFILTGVLSVVFVAVVYLWRYFNLEGIKLKRH